MAKQNFPPRFFLLVD